MFFGSREQAGRDGGQAEQEPRPGARATLMVIYDARG